jgi:hypothetical protein
VSKVLQKSDQPATQAKPVEEPTGARLPFAGLGTSPAAVRQPKGPPVLLAYSPDRNPDVFKVDGVDRVLPILRTVRCRAGTNGITRRKNGDFDLSGLEDNLRESGWKLIDPTRYNVAHEGGWRPVWSTVRADGRVVESPAKYAAFVASLVDDGTLPPPSEAGIERQAEHLRAVATHPKMVDRPRDREKAEARVRLLDAALDAAGAA